MQNGARHQPGEQPGTPGPVPLHIDKLVRHMITTQNRVVTDIVKNRYKMIAERQADEKRKVNPHRPFHEVIDDGAWRGEPCFVVGGGPSLRNFDFERLRGAGRVIAINKSYLDIPFADVCFFMDGSRNTFYGLAKANNLSPDSAARWREFEGYKVYLNLVGRRWEDVYSIRSLGRTGISNSIRKGLFHGNNSGVGAVGLAVCLGADPIYLLGIDGKTRGGKTHYHDGYLTRKLSNRTLNSFVIEFHKLGRLLRRTKSRVVNLNPHSAVRCFPFSTPDEVLKGGSEE